MAIRSAISFVSEARLQLDKATSRVYLFDMMSGRHDDILSKSRQPQGRLWQGGPARDVLRRREQEGFVDDFGLGHQFSFPSKEDLRDFLTVLIDNGYTSLNMFIMNPSVDAAQQEVQWMADLREEILRQTIAEARTP